MIPALNQSLDQGDLKKPPNAMTEHFYELQITTQKPPFMPLQVQANLAIALVETLFEKSLKLLVKQSASLARSHSSNPSTNTGEEYGVEKRRS